MATKMSESKKHIIYSAGDIQRYLTGKMSNTEMHAIEKAALDDPLLAEAMEGYDGMEQKDWNHELAALKIKLSEVENSPIVPVYKTSFTRWWKAAAAIIIIGSSISIAYFSSTKNKSTTQLAEASIKQEAVVQSFPESTDSIKIQNEIATTEPNKPVEQKLAAADKKEPENNSTTLLTEAKQATTSDDEFIYKPEKKSLEIASKDIATADMVKDEYKENAASKMKAPAIQNNEMAADKNLSSRQMNNNVASNSNTGNASANYFNAQVVTPDQEPIAFANVNIPRTNTPIQADENGKFKIPSSDTSINVVVNSLGYQAKKYTLNNQASMSKIVMQPDNNALSEVVVTSAYAARKKISKALNKESLNQATAVPAAGWDHYNKYLSDNTVRFNLNNLPPVHGVVAVTLFLKANSEIKKVKINKSLCEKCDEEAIRLIKQGPKWSVKNNEATTIIINVVF